MAFIESRRWNLGEEFTLREIHFLNSTAVLEGTSYFRPVSLGSHEHIEFAIKLHGAKEVAAVGKGIIAE